MTAIVQITQATKPILPPKNIRLFCDDEYAEDRIEIYTDNAFFVVEHETNVEREEGVINCWSYSTESHYTKSDGTFTYEASTEIKAIKILIADGVESQCIKGQLPSEFIKQIELFIANMAEQYAKDADDE